MLPSLLLVCLAAGACPPSPGPAGSGAAPRADEPEPAQEARGQGPAAGRGVPEAAAEPAPQAKPAEASAPVAGAPPPPKASGPSAAQRLHLASRQLADELFTLRPWLAAECGEGGGPFALADPTPAAVARWAATLDSVDLELLRLPEETLPARRRVDRDWLRASIHAETLLFEAGPTHRQDPLHYVELARIGWLQLQEAALEPRRRELVRLRYFVDLPDLWVAARNNLTLGVRAWTEEAVLAAEDLLALLERTPPPGPEVLEDAGVRELLVSRRADALASTRKFREWLGAELILRGQESYAMDAAAWRMLLADVTGSDVSIPELERTLLLDLARLGRELREHPGDEATSPPLEGERAAERVRAAGAALLEVGERVGLRAGRMEPLEDWRVRARTPGLSDLPVARWSPGATPPGVLELGLPSYAWSPARISLRNARLSPGALVALAVRYGPVGEWNVLRRTIFTAVPHRLFITGRCAREAFGLYATDWVLRVGPSPLLSRPDVVAELRRQRVTEALRLWTSLGLHAQRRPLELVVEDYHLHSGLSLDLARREVMEVMRDPTAGMAYLAYREILALEEELRGKGPARAGVMRTLELLQEHPAARVKDLRATRN